MTKKAPKSPKKESPPIQINRSRGGGKKRPDLFARLRNDEHPIETLLGTAHSDAQILDNSDVRGNQSTDVRNIGYSDSQYKTTPDAQKIESTDTQTASQMDAQSEFKSDARDIELPGAQSQSLRTPSNTDHGRPISASLDPSTSQLRTAEFNKPGQPSRDDLGVLTPKNRTRTSKSSPQLDTQTSNPQNTDARRKKWDSKYDSKRSTDRLAIRPDREILKKIKIFCVEKNLKLTEFIEIACLRFIELDAQTVDASGVLTPLDDRRLMTMYKSKPFIINLYLRYNSIFNELSSSDGKNWSARWNPRDDEAGLRFNELPPTIIELGIIQTQIQKGIGSGKIQTFKYYTDEIQKVVDSGVSDDVLSTLLIYHRSVWRNQTGREVDLSFLEEAKSQSQK